MSVDVRVYTASPGWCGSHVTPHAGNYFSCAAAYEAAEAAAEAEAAAAAAEAAAAAAEEAAAAAVATGGCAEQKAAVETRAVSCLWPLAFLGRLG